LDLERIVKDVRKNISIKEFKTILKKWPSSPNQMEKF
jgi:hypothetical protein